MTFLAWQLDIALDFLVDSLAPPSAAQLTAVKTLDPSRRECVRALAQLLYENGERLGTRFEYFLPSLLDLADPAAVDLEIRQVAFFSVPFCCWCSYLYRQV